MSPVVTLVLPLLLLAFAQPGRVESTVSTMFGRDGENVGIALMDIRNVPAGATIVLTCTGRGCPFESKTIESERALAALQLGKYFGETKLKPGTVIEIRISRASSIGKVFRYQTQATGNPRITTKCLPPGAKTPVAC
jgi:hypothetical protein